MFIEKYVKEIQLEATCIAELATVYVAPAVQAHIGRLATALNTATQAGVKSQAMAGELQTLVKHYDALGKAVADLAATQTSAGHDARAVADKIRPALAAVRAEADALEQLVADDLWPLPKYREMLLCGV